MDTTLKRIGSKLCFKTSDPAEKPIDAWWLKGKKKKRNKHHKRHRLSQQAGYELFQQRQHLASIRQEIKQTA